MRWYGSVVQVKGLVVVGDSIDRPCALGCELGHELLPYRHEVVQPDSVGQVEAGYRQVFGQRRVGHLDDQLGLFGGRVTSGISGGTNQCYIRLGSSVGAGKVQQHLDSDDAIELSEPRFDLGGDVTEHRAL